MIKNKEMKQLIVRLVRIERMIEEMLEYPNIEPMTDPPEFNYKMTISAVLEMEAFLGKRIEFMGIS